MNQRRPCACGGTVSANPLDPVPGVRLHNLTERHVRWSEATTWADRRPATVELREPVGDQPPPPPVRP